MVRIGGRVWVWVWDMVRIGVWVWVMVRVVWVRVSLLSLETREAAGPQIWTLPILHVEIMRTKLAHKHHIL